MKRQLSCLSAILSLGLALTVPGALAQTVTSGPDVTLQRACTNNCFQQSENIAVDGAGNAIAIWVETTGDITRPIVYSRYDAATNRWSASKVLSVESFGSSPKVGMDAQGNAIAVWSAWIDEGLDGLRFATFSADTKTWTPPRNVSTPQDDRRGPVTLEVAANGDAFITLSGRNSYGAVVRYDSATSTWSALEEVASGRAQIAADLSGNALVADQAVTYMEPSRSVSARRFISATNTYTDYVYLDSGLPVRDPRTNEELQDYSFNLLAASKDVNGSEMVLWERTLYDYAAGRTIREVRSARYVPRIGSWVKKTIPKISNGQTLQAKMVADGSGNVTAVWVQYVSGYAKTVSARYSSATGKWSTPTVISRGSFHTRDASVDIDRNGNAIATWSQRTDTGIGSSTGKIFKTTAARYRVSTNTWGTPSTIQDADRNGYRPFMGVDNTGRAVVIWNQDSWGVVDGQTVKVLRADRVIPQ